MEAKGVHGHWYNVRRANASSGGRPHEIKPMRICVSAMEKGDKSGLSECECLYFYVTTYVHMYSYIHTINICSSARNAEGVGSARAAYHFIITFAHTYVVRVYLASGRRRTGSFNLSCAFLLSHDKPECTNNTQKCPYVPHVGICM